MMFFVAGLALQVCPYVLTAFCFSLVSMVELQFLYLRVCMSLTLAVCLVEVASGHLLQSETTSAAETISTERKGGRSFQVIKSPASLSKVCIATANNSHRPSSVNGASTCQNFVNRHRNIGTMYNFLNKQMHALM